MNRHRACISLLLLFSFFSPNLSAQHQKGAHTKNHTSTESSDTHKLRHNRLSVLLYHSYVRIRTPDGPHLVVIPSIGLDYEYWFTHRFGLGIHNDLIFTHKVQEDLLSDNAFPFLSSVDVLCKVHKGLVLLFGPGIEFEEKEHLFFFRGGLEYEINLGGHWDVCPTIFYDNRRNAYNTCSFGIGIGKTF